VITGQREQLNELDRKEAELRGTFEEKQGQAANLEPLKLQLAQMEQQLQQMLRQLPSKTEMPELLVDVSQAALSAGLETQLFEPGPEAIQEGFYAEKPIKLRMLGNYHQFGTFISEVARLPRVVILTMHDVSLKPSAPTSGKNGSPSQLTLEGTVKTYRYVDEDEADAAAPKKPGAPAAKAGK